MAWVRMTDTCAFHPTVLEVLEHPEADERSVDEVLGFMVRLATQSAAHYTDYVIAWSTAVTTATSAARAERLLLQAQFAGYGELQVDDTTGRRRFVMAADPEFIHLKTADEAAWERQRKADNGNPSITVPVRRRDGDACRYCGNVVNWSARRGGTRGTYDHRPPGQPGSAETSVVACWSCNAARGADPVEIADQRRPLMDPPTTPYYHSGTREWLAANAVVLAQHGMTPPELMPDQQNLRAGRPAPGAQAAPTTVRRATEPTAPARTPAAASRPTQRHDRRSAPRQQRHDGSSAGSTHVSAPRSATPTPTPPRPAGSGRSRQVRGLQDSTSPGRDGAGRAGTGLVSPDQPLTSPHPSTPDPARPRPRRRGRRGGRARTTGDS